ncbi:MAG: tail fiber domain-containing protein, partial [Bacteroidetes bacterium]|nr:tail fiber domain-containing protein [Bacteroidota bacterium]
QQVYVQNADNLNDKSVEAYTYNNQTTSYGGYFWNSGSDAFTKYGSYSGTYNDGAGDSFGVYGYNNSYGTGKPYAGYFAGYYSSSIPVGYGIYATSLSATDNWAAHFNGKTLISHADSIPLNTFGTLNVENRTDSPTNYTGAFRSNYLGNSDIRGVFATSICSDGWGYGGEFYGGYRGVYAAALGGAYTGGIYNYFSAGGVGTGARYGVYGSASGSTGTVGNGVTVANYGVYSSGAAYATAYYTSSDQSLKTDVEPLSGSLAKIMALKAYTYMYKHDSEIEQAMNLPENEQLGFLAQEMETVIPQAVANVPVEIGASTPEREDDRTEWIKGIQPDFLLPVIVQAMQEQQGILEQKNEKIAALTNEVEDLQNRLDALESTLQKMSSAMQNCCLSEKVDDISTATLNNSGARLEQNAPNPFYNKTIIQYYLPEDTRNANLQIVNIEGKVVKTISLDTTGYGTTTINGNDLAAGTYVYSLVINGKVSASKEMILTK